MSPESLIYAWLFSFIYVVRSSERWTKIAFEI